jgi:uncharacterized protein (DUF1501 family)
MVRTLYRERRPEMLAVLDRGLRADYLAERSDGDDGDISSLRKGFRGAGRLVAAPDGPRIAVLSVGGFDTHSDQGAIQGMLSDVLRELDLGIADFKETVGGAWGQTVMVLATEFGRTVRVNGDDGTDHGVGTTVLLAGGSVNGGKVYGDWPGLAPAQLYEGSDLRPTTDLRAVFKGVLKDHLDIPSTSLNATIFPDSAGVAPMQNLVKRGPELYGEAKLMRLSRASPRSEPPIARYRKGARVSRPARA